MVDTNIINRILDHDLELKVFKEAGKTFLATHIQRDEIKKTSDENRRKELLYIFEEIVNRVPTESALWGKSKWGECKWAEDNLVEEILKELDKKDKRRNNTEDALIADTAIKNDYVLVTDDGDLYDVVTEVFNGSAQKWEEFLNSS